jgi:hypothetical protein
MDTKSLTAKFLRTATPPCVEEREKTRKVFLHKPAVGS